MDKVSLKDANAVRQELAQRRKKLLNDLTNDAELVDWYNTKVLPAILGCSDDMLVRVSELGPVSVTPLRTHSVNMHIEFLSLLGFNSNYNGRRLQIYTGRFQENESSDR